MISLHFKNMYAIMKITVLGGAVAAPCTRNPLERGRIPVRGATFVRSAVRN